MNILLIDNKTILIPQLKKLFRNHIVQIFPWDKIRDDVVKAANLMVFTGSSKYSVIKDADIYKQQTILLQNSDKPILGICAGFELIVHSFGGKIKRRKERITGPVKFDILQDNEIFAGLKDTTVREAHHYTAVNLPPSLLALAKSQFGYEIIKHKNRFIYGFQFHPELETKEKTGEILINNLLGMIS